METTPNSSLQDAQNLEQLKAQFAEFQKNQEKPKRKTKAEILAKYFVPRNNTEKFRILPSNGRKPIEEAFFHVVSTIGSGGKKNHNTVIYCPAHNDPKVQKMDADGKPLFDQNGKPVLVPAPCPLCEKYKKLIAKQDPSIKMMKKEQMDDAQLKIKASNDAIYKEAISWEAKKFYIIKGIDKGAEKDGVKFWRFKYNFKKQGTLDKLMPILDDYIKQHNADYAHPINGCDLIITMADAEFNNITYKQITAITTRAKTPLHSDPMVAQQWLEDKSTWREVFLPKKAPNTSEYDYLVMVSKGETPYWDESDTNNKHWVFPNNPELEKLANTRTQNLDSQDENFEQASDLSDTQSVTIGNVQPSNVNAYKEDSVNLGEVAMSETAPVTPPVTPPVTENNEPVPDAPEDYNDLPF